MIKIFTSQLLKEGVLFQPDEYNRNHLKVMRTFPGEQIYIGDSRGKEFLAVLEEKYSLRIIRETLRGAKPSREVVLFAGLLKKQKFEDLIFKSSQLGVSRVVPMITSRTVKVIKDNSREKIYLRWRRKARHGAELSMREKIPSITRPVSFESALEIYRKSNFGAGLFLYEEEKTGRFITGNDLKSKIALFVGPEGGFTSAEAALAERVGFSFRSLGKLILDSEVACLASASLLLCGSKLI